MLKVINVVIAVCTITNYVFADCPDSRNFNLDPPKGSPYSVGVPVGWEVFVGDTGFEKLTHGPGKLESVRIAGKFLPAGCEKNSNKNACKAVETTDIYCNYTYPKPQDGLELHLAAKSVVYTFAQGDKWLCVKNTFAVPLCVCNITPYGYCGFKSFGK